MRLGPKDESSSPLDEVLEQLPDEEPPSDLQTRCVSALRSAQAEHPREPAGPLWPAMVKSVAGLAAAFVLVVALSTALQPRLGRAPSTRPSWRAQAERPLTTDAPAAEEAPESIEALPQRLPSAPPTARGRTERADAIPSLGSKYRPAPASAGVDHVDGHSVFDSFGGPADDRVRAAQQRLGTELEAEVPAGDEVLRAPADYLDFPGSPPAKPWRDLSGDRQKVTHKEMGMEVKDVEDAHQRATSIIEKADGYVQSEELRIGQGERDTAHLLARVPIESLDGVVAQLRDLGRVVKLIGQTDDETKEYYARGARIRELGAKECELVEKYLKETNRHRKQQLYSQIMSIREQNRQQKEPLLELSDKTHFAFLDLTLIEAGGPGRFLSRVLANAGNVGLWLAVSAIFWVPAMLVITLLWRHVLRRAS